MRRRIELIVLGLLVALSLGGTCRQELAQDTADAFLTEFASDIANALSDALTAGQTP